MIHVCTRQGAAGLLKSITQGRKRINVITNIDVAISTITSSTKVSIILQTLTKDLRFVVIVVVIIIFLSLLNHCESCDGKGLEPPPIQNATVDFDSLWFIHIP